MADNWQKFDSQGVMKTFAARDSGGIYTPRFIDETGLSSSTPAWGRIFPISSATFPYIFLSKNTSGANAIAGGVVGQTVRTYRLCMIAHGDVDVTLQSASNTLFGPIPFRGAGSSFVLDYSGEPWFTTTSGEDFNWSFSANVQVIAAFYAIRS